MAYPSASNTINPACKKIIHEAEERNGKIFEALLQAQTVKIQEIDHEGCDKYTNVVSYAQCT